MLEAVKARNHAFGDSWVGIGYSREQAIYNLEKDFVNQYYSLGILGLLLFVSFYVYCPLRLLLRCLRQKPGCARLRVFYAATALAIFILAAWFSGNILDSLLMSTLFAFIAAASGVEEPRLQRTA